MFDTESSVPREEGPNLKRLKLKLRGGLSIRHLQSQLNEILFAFSGDVHTVYAPESDYNQPILAKLKKAATARVPQPTVQSLDAYMKSRKPELDAVREKLEGSPTTHINAEVAKVRKTHKADYGNYLSELNKSFTAPTGKHGAVYDIDAYLNAKHEIDSGPMGAQARKHELDALEDSLKEKGHGPAYIKDKMSEMKSRHQIEYKNHIAQKAQEHYGEIQSQAEKFHGVGTPGSKTWGGEPIPAPPNRLKAYVGKLIQSDRNTMAVETRGSRDIIQSRRKHLGTLSAPSDKKMLGWHEEDVFAPNAKGEMKKAGTKEVRPANIEDAKKLRFIPGELQRNAAKRASSNVFYKPGASPKIKGNLLKGSDASHLAGYKENLSTLVEQHRAAAEGKLSHHEENLQNILHRGAQRENIIARSGPGGSQIPVKSDYETQQEATALRRRLSDPAVVSSPLTDVEKETIGTKLSYGRVGGPGHYIPPEVTKGSPISADIVGKVQAALDKLRDRAGYTPHNRMQLGREILSKGELFKDLPRTLAPAAPRFPHLAALGKGAAIAAGGAALIGGGIYGARKLFGKKKETQFAAKGPGEGKDIIKKALEMIQKPHPAGVLKVIEGGAKPESFHPVGSSPGMTWKGAGEYIEKHGPTPSMTSSSGSVAAGQSGGQVISGANPLKQKHKKMLKGAAERRARIKKMDQRAAIRQLAKLGMLRHPDARGMAQLGPDHPVAEAVGSTISYLTDQAGKLDPIENSPTAKFLLRNEQIKTEELTRKLAKEKSKRAPVLPESVVKARNEGYAAGEAGMRSQMAEHEAGLKKSMEDLKAQSDIKTYAAERSAKTARNWAIGGTAGAGVAGGAVGYILGRRRQRQEEFRSILSEIRFMDRRALLARDRYVKAIQESDLDRSDTNYIRAAGAGAALGGIGLTKYLKPIQGKAGTLGVAKLARSRLARASLAGAVAGLGVQKATRIATSKMRDQYGERTLKAKRIDKAPWIIGSVAAGGLLAKRAYGLSALERLVQFDDQQSAYDDWAYRKLYGRPRRRVIPIARDLHKWGGRTGRAYRDFKLQRAGTPNVDARGRPRTPEWKKPWALGAAIPLALGGVVLGGRWARRTVMHPDSALGKAVQGTMATFKGASEEIKSVFTPPIKGQDLKVVKGGVTKADQSILNRINAQHRKVTGEKPEVTTSSKLRLVRFAETVPDWDLRDARGRSVRVFAPYSQRRYRRQKTWSERKDNQRLLWGGAATGTAGLGALGTWLALRKRGAPQPPPPGGRATVTHPIRRVTREFLPEAKQILKRASSKAQLISFEEKKKNVAWPYAAGAAPAGLLYGGLVHPGRPLKEGEDITGRRVIRSHSRVPWMQHEGIGVEGGHVVHVQRAPKEPMATIEKVDLPSFGKGRPMRVIDKTTDLPTAKKAMEHVGKCVPYGIMGSSCQHFTQSLKKGHPVALPRQFKRALAGAGIAGAGAYGIAKGVNAYRNRTTEFARKGDDDHLALRRTGRFTATAAGVGLGAAGLSLIPGTHRLGKIAGRTWLRESQGRMAKIGRSILKPAEDPNLGGKMVFNYIDAAHKLMGEGVKGKIANKVLMKGRHEPFSVVGGIVRKVPGSGDAFHIEHYQRFRSGHLQALDHWQLEHGLLQSKRMLPEALEGYKTRMTRRRAAVDKELKDRLYNVGENERDALQHVAYNSKNPLVHQYFNRLANMNKWPATKYAKMTGGATVGSIGIGAGTVAAANWPTSPNGKKKR